MSAKKASRAPAAQHLFLRVGVPVIGTWLLILLTYLLPLVDSTRAPYFDLMQPFSNLAYWLSQSGGIHGVPIVAVSMVALLVTRGGITVRRKWKEFYIYVLIALIFAGGGAALNEHFLKNGLKVPRPNIIWLAGENGTGPLGMTPEEFYGSGNKETRRNPLATVLNKVPSPVEMSSNIKAHWIEETGYSLPSGHSFSVMFFATFFLMSAATYLATKRIWIFYLLLPWAAAVCYSRPILRVHTPTDIAVGALQGLVVGLLAWFFARTIIRGFAEKEN